MRRLEVRRSIRSSRLFYLLQFLCLSLCCGTAQAFVLWSEALPPLTRSDMAAISELTKGLDLQEPGTTWYWENPETGHSGSVTLIRVFQRDGMNCRILKHHVQAGTDEPWVSEFTSCLNPEGDWELRPDMKPQGPVTDDIAQ